MPRPQRVAGATERACLESPARTSAESLARDVQLGGFPHVDRHRRTLSRYEIEAPQVLPLRRRRLVADQSVDERREVLVQLLLVEGDLADRHVDDAELVRPELHLA